MGRKGFLAVVAAVAALAVAATGLMLALRPDVTRRDERACRSAGGVWIPAGNHAHSFPETDGGDEIHWYPTRIHYHPQPSCV